MAPGWEIKNRGRGIGTLVPILIYRPAGIQKRHPEREIGIRFPEQKRTGTERVSTVFCVGRNVGNLEKGKEMG